MKNFAFFAGLAVVVVAAASVEAGPIVGQFVSLELGGTVRDGRWSESYAGGGPGQVGDAVHAASWDGVALGGQWELSGPAIAAPPSVIMDTRVGGTGTVIYYTVYSGGSLTLTDAGPWWNAVDAPDTEYLVNLSFYSHTTSNEYVAGQLVASTTVVQMRGTFVDYAGYDLSFVVAVAVPLGEGSPLPADYPDWVPDTATNGAWGIAQKIRAEITPEPASMGLVALGLAALAARRRRKAGR